MKTFQINIEGIVQGVGFRPFVFALANEFDLKGTVSNNENGVVIFLSGSENNIQSFYQILTQNPPPVSKIKNSKIHEISFQNFKDFKIIPSSKTGKLNLTLTPDFAICEDCKKEIKDPDNRRFNYPFTTCVNCGPRWAITKTFPFERDHTSIHKFEMCETCRNEYKNPADRRFHSQTNSCTSCGVILNLTNVSGSTVNVSEKEIFKKIVSLINMGKIIAIKNTGGYLLCCDATNEKVVKKLRKKKKRPQKPFAILYPSLELLESHLKVNEQQNKALISTERPIVILQKRGFKGNLAFAELIPGLEQLGVMLPYSGVLQLLAEELETPIVATSGNFHGSPIISDNDQAVEVLSEIADYFLHHNLEITNPQDDSVIKFSAKFNQKVLFRRSRGYAPNYFDFSVITDKKILAMGGGLKSTIAFLPNDNLYISQYLGNLDHFDVYERFVKTTTNFTELFEQNPDTILIDSHPAYQSTQFGKELSKKFNTDLFKIQHHKAHFTSVLGEHELFGSDEKILGVVWDGTGYGDDKNIWGGEFFTYQNNKINRLTHFEYFDWLAGDKMANEPRISLLSLADEEIEIVNKFSKDELNIYQSLKKRNKLKTSSVGRLFDAVASLLDICDYNTYEGEAAILLENQTTDYDLATCTSYCVNCESEFILTKSIVRNIYFDLKKGTHKKQVIRNFIFTLATVILQIAKKNKINKIALSGGVFQNTTLIDMLKELNRNEHELFFNRRLAPNDENISFGQMMYYLNCKEE
ncbi:MAG: carbamoyltransferase HypF [Bacteroidota bacterium]